MTYVVNGLSRKIAVVGDAIFAGSMGGGNVSYNAALQTNLDPAAAKLLTWEAWRKGREHLSEATASQRLQPAPR